MDVRAPFNGTVFDGARICVGEDLQQLTWRGGFCRFGKPARIIPDFYSLGIGI